MCWSIPEILHSYRAAWPSRQQDTGCILLRFPWCLLKCFIAPLASGFSWSERSTEIYRDYYLRFGSFFLDLLEVVKPFSSPKGPLEGDLAVSSSHQMFNPHWMRISIQPSTWINDFTRVDLTLIVYILLSGVFYVKSREKQEMQEITSLITIKLHWCKCI